MATEFYNRNWRMPNSWNGSTDNNNKVSNYSMSFDGSSEYIDTGVSILHTISPTTFSVSVWIKVNDVSTDMNGGLGNIIADAPAGSPNNGGFWLAYDDRGGALSPTEGISYNIKTSAGFQRGRSTNGVITSGSWFHVALVLDGQATLYINGVDVTDRTTDNSGTLETQSNELTIGAFDNGSFEYLGSLDHVAIFDYALSASQVTSLYGNSTDGVGNPMSLSAKPKAFYAIGDYAAFNGTDYLVNNGALSDYNFTFNPTGNLNQSVSLNQSYSYTNITVSTWVKMTSSTDSLIYDNRDDSSNRVFIYYGAVQNKFFWGVNNVTQVQKGDEGGGNIQIGKWYHIVGTYDGTTSKLYVNNVSAQVTGSTTVNISSQNATIGALSTAITTYEARAEFSNVQIFNTTLAATGSNSVETLYNNGTPLSSMSGFTSLVGWWKLDASATFDGSNWSIPDDSSNSNTGTSNNMTAANLVQSNLLITQPYSRYALYFDGVSDYATSATNPAQLNTVSLSIWVKRDGHQQNHAGVFGVRNPGVIGGNFGVCWDLAFNTSTNKIEFRVGDTSNSYDTAIQNSAMVDDTWTHVVGVADGTNIFLYINGSKQTNTSTYTSPIVTPATKIHIGAQGSSPATNEFKGSLSNAAVFNTGLSQAQVTELYNSGKPSNLNSFSAYSNLVTWYQLGENMSFVGSGAQGTGGTEWTILDEKGTNNATGQNLAPAESSLVNGVGTSGNGLSDGMGGADNIIGDAPYSTANAVSYGMGVDARVSGSGNVPS